MAEMCLNLRLQALVHVPNLSRYCLQSLGELKRRELLVRDCQDLARRRGQNPQAVFRMLQDDNPPATGDSYRYFPGMEETSGVRSCKSAI